MILFILQVCNSVGIALFGVGIGTHCFQKFIQKEIHVFTRFGEPAIHTELNFRDGCSCGWATGELGKIRDFHYGNAILDVCKMNKI